MSVAAKLILPLAAFLVASCATVANPAEKELVGNWHSDDRLGHTAEYAFFDNGTFSGSVKGDGGTAISQFTGKWRFRDGAILYQYTGDKTGRIPVGTKDRDKLLKIGKGYFLIETADGSVRKYVRSGSG